MFSGIVEASASIKQATGDSQLVKITIEKPDGWNDLGSGDSIAVNGVCLTLESQTTSSIQFALGPETLRVTGWRPQAGERVNLERSLRFGDRVHGHLVNGHVDEVGRVVGVEDRVGELSDTRDLLIQASEKFTPFLWRKGSVAINGVSLTINAVEGNSFQVGLIPETLKRTNLRGLKVGDTVNLEADSMARAWYHWREQR